MPRTFRIPCMVGVAIFAVAAMASSARATLVMDFNYPTSGTVNDDVGPCSFCANLSVASYTEDGIVDYSYSADPIEHLLSANYPALNLALGLSGVPPAIYTGPYFSEQGIVLVGGGYFNVESFELVGCGGTLEALDVVGATVNNKAGVGTSVCQGLVSYDVSTDPLWQHVNELTFSADGSFVMNSYELANLVLDPVSAVPEPGSLVILTTGLAGLCLFRRRQRKAAGGLKC